MSIKWSQDDHKTQQQQIACLIYFITHEQFLNILNILSLFSAYSIENVEKIIKLTILLLQYNIELININKIVKAMHNLKTYSATQQIIKTSQTLTQMPQQKNDNFDFLIQSIDRQKFTTLNHNQNHSYFDKQNQHYNHHEGRLSIKVRPNVQQVFQKDREKSMSGVVNLVKSTFVGNHLGESAERETLKCKDQYRVLLDNLLYKMKKYLTLTEPLIHNSHNNKQKEQKCKKQAIKTACEVIQALTSLQNSLNSVGMVVRSIKNREQSMSTSLNSTGNLVLGSNKQMSSSFHFPNQALQDSVSYIKKIENLEQQKLQLQNIISQHERKNIKMFIQLNEGQSQQIECYKKQLSSLFQKYKQLEKLVRKQSDKSKNLQLLINRLEEEKLKIEANKCNFCCRLGRDEGQYRKKILEYQGVINQQNQYLGRALEEIQLLKGELMRYRRMCEQNSRISLNGEQKQRQRNKTPQQNRAMIENIGENNMRTKKGETSDENTKARISMKRSQIIQQSPFTNITLKPSMNLSAQSHTKQHESESLYRVLFTQATMIDQILHH